MLELRSRAQELCESRGGRPGLPVSNSPYGLCGREATLNLNWICRAQELCESRGGCPVPNSPYSLFELELDLQSSGAV